jgi:hypothetical protein
MKDEGWVKIKRRRPARGQERRLFEVGVCEDGSRRLGEREISLPDLDGDAGDSDAVAVVPEVLGKIVQIPVKPRNLFTAAHRIVMAAVDPAGDVIDLIPNAVQRVALAPVGAEMIRLVPDTVIMFAKMPYAIMVVPIIVIVIVAIRLCGG